MKRLYIARDNFGWERIFFNKRRLFGWLRRIGRTNYDEVSDGSVRHYSIERKDKP